MVNNHILITDFSLEECVFPSSLIETSRQYYNSYVESDMSHQLGVTFVSLFGVRNLGGGILLAAQPFLLSAAPALMCPEPHLGMFLYVRFKQGEVTVGESVFFCCGRMILHRDYVQVVVTSAWTTHAPVHHEGINLAANVLSTDENCGVVIEEGHEMVAGH